MTQMSCLKPETTVFNGEQKESDRFHKCTAMEIRNGGASSKGVLEPVSETSDVFKNNILAPLKSAYLYDESKLSFRYKSAVLIKNPELEEKYNAFRTKRREAGYSEEDLKESFGFLLFEDVNKANTLGETGVQTGNSTCTTLGDSSKGVYISMYSDCLDLNRWYHGKSGYIAIIRLTKGRVKKVVENYTHNFTAPTVKFDCHVSEQLPSVSAKTSSFLAFERTQYYMYELLDDGSNVTVQSPSAACPFAIVSFSYLDTKATLVEPPEESEVKKQVSHYCPWRGLLQIGTQLFHVELRSTSVASIPAELPPVVKVDHAISMLDLRRLLPRGVFETFFSGEVLLDSLYCSLCELFSSEAAQTSSLSLLLLEIKKKDIALTVPLNDGGFLILLHSSHFLKYDESATEVLQGMFVFPDSRVIQRGTKFGQRKPPMSSEILRVLPVLSYAEGEVEKTPIDPSEELCEVLAQQMQSYAALINPGLGLSPSREVSIFPDHYDVPDAHKHLYLSPDWTTRGWQGFKSYLSKPVSYQLLVSKASEILVAGQEARMEDLDDDVYICLSSPEEAPANLVEMGSEDQLTGETFTTNVVDSCLTHSKAQVDLIAVPQNVVPDHLQAGDATKDTEKSDMSILIRADDMGANNLQRRSTSDPPAELIVSFTSAERTVTNESLIVINTEAATNHNDFQLSDFSTTKLSTRVTSPNAETVETKNVLVGAEVPNLTKRKRKKQRRGYYSKHWKKVSRACVETPSFQSVKIPVEDDNLERRKEAQTKESSGRPQLSIPSNIDWRKERRRKRIFGKLSSTNKKLRSARVLLALAEESKSDNGQQSLESTILMELETCPQRKKMERWDLKPVISECGRILVPHGSVDIADQIKSLKDKLPSKIYEQCPEKTLVDVSVKAHDTIEMQKESSTASETAEATTTKDGVNNLQTNLVSHFNHDPSILRQLGDGNGSLSLNQEKREHSATNDGTGTPPSEAVQEKTHDTPTPGKCATKGELLLMKLKSVLLRGKRKAGLLLSEGMTADTDQNTEPRLKLSKVDSDIGMLKGDVAVTNFQDDQGVMEVSKVLSVDPVFAYALGLTPKETPDKRQKTEGQDTRQRKDSSETQEQTSFGKQSQIIQKPPSIFLRSGRIKTLKKHQAISEEYVKQKWWLHFQTPACLASEKLEFKEYTRNDSVRKKVKGKINSSSSSADALNLLADLALNTSNEKIPQQPDPALEREPETSWKKCDLVKEVSSAEQESVLHALLRQPAGRPIQPLESPSPSHLMGGIELVGLVSIEHAYSLPPSSSLLGLSGTPFQVSPLSGSTRLLNHHQAMYGDGIKTLHPSVGQEERSEHNHRTPEYHPKNMVHKRKFRHSRTFVSKDGSIQVTKQWKEKYDFNLDSKFTSDSKDRAINRALHGPWDFSIHDTIEEVRLIVHMWIGLFYSRSTPRFFNCDSNLTHLCSEERYFLEMSSGMVSAPSQSDLKVNSFAPPLSVTDISDPSLSRALDLSKKDNSVLDHESVILDLSLKSPNPEIVNSDPQVIKIDTSVFGEQKKDCETVTTLKSAVELQETSTSQSNKTRANSKEIVNEVNDVRSTKEASALPKNGRRKHSDLPTFKGDITLIPEKAEMENVFVLPNNNQTTSGFGNILHGCNNDKMHMKHGSEHPEYTEMSLLEKPGIDSSKSMTDEEVDFNKEANEVVHSIEHDEIESMEGENLEVKEKPCREGFKGNYPQRIQDSGKVQNVNEDVVCCTTNEQKLLEENHFGKEDVFEERGHSVSAVEADSDLSDQPLAIMCNGQDSVKRNSITEGDCQVTLNERPPQVHNKDHGCHDLQLRKLSASGSVLTDDLAISEETHPPSEMEPVYSEPAVEEMAGNSIFLADEAHHQKAALPMSDETTCSLDEFCADGSNPQIDNNVDTENQNKLITNVNLSSDDNEYQDTKSVEGEQKVENTTKKEPIHASLLPQCQVGKKCEDEVALTKERDLKGDQTNEGTENMQSRVIIPFIGIDISGGDTTPPHDLHSQDEVGEVQGQNELPFSSEDAYPGTVLPTEVCCKSQLYSKKTELPTGKIPISLIDVSETKQSEGSGSESDGRCPTPTMDEKPYEYLPGSSPVSSTSALSGSETCKSIHTHKTSVGDEMPNEQNNCLESTVNGDPKPHHGLHPDLELRTLRVLQSIGKFFYKSSHIGKSSQIETFNVKHSLDQTSNDSGKYMSTCSTPSHTSADLKYQNTSNTKTGLASASTSQELLTESSDHFIKSPFKSKLEEVLGVRLQLNETDSKVHQHDLEITDELQETSVGQDGHSHKSFPSTGGLQGNKANINKDRHKTSSPTNLNHEARSHSQRPVMAVKPSKSDETQADCISEDRQFENYQIVISNVPPIHTKTSKIPYTKPTSMLNEKKTGSLKRNSETLKDEQEAIEISSKYSWSSNDISKFKSPSSLLVQSFESATSSSKLVDENQGCMTNCLVVKDGKTTKDSIEINQNDCSDASTSHAAYKDESIIDESLFLGPHSSLTCTVYNTSQKGSCTFLEKLSQRCIQDDLTRASVEQECLIFSENMKRVLKGSKTGSIHQLDIHNKLNLSCASPVTVHFSSLEEQEDSVDHFDALSLVGQKIIVDLSDRKDLADTKEEQKKMHPPKLSQGTGNPLEHAGVSGVTAECTRRYEETMNDVCAVKKVPTRPKHLIMDRGYPKTEPSNHFDFCDQMKREMDQSFRNNLNSVVKKSCKTKYRFYILVTSDDTFFEETKALLEAEGHTAVQPTEFFLGENSALSLLIILRNEDIAEHVCEVPHLLQLRKSPSVQFAGIDEPDDVVNLTHQELFTRGGFIMFDRAVLEPLSLCNMKKISEILQELSRTGKWKWMLHYRDSRQLKENARRSAEAKEKKHFLQWCQETGKLEVLPYHECDLVSKDQPDYLTCLVRLQVQNISARYPVFVTDTTSDSAFESNGIFTMDFDSFLTCSSSTTFTV